MWNLHLVCHACGQEFPATHRAPMCTVCGGPLDAVYHTSPRADAGKGLGVWQWGDAFPLATGLPQVSLGEGNTPVVPLERVGAVAGCPRLWAKLEYLNPTGSFKDRGSAVLLSVLKAWGVTRVVEDSSGNAGASLSAYAARAGVQAVVYVPDTAPRPKVQQIRVYGAEVRVVPGGRQAATQAAQDAWKRGEGVYAAHHLSPYFLEGMKSFALEVFAQMGGDVPEHMVFPVGNGSLLIGTWLGLLVLKQERRLVRVPRLHAVQAQRVCPLVAAWQEREWTPRPGTRTIAGGIAVSHPPRKAQVLQALWETGGQAVAVAEKDILAWQALLAEREGVFCEPTAAAAFAGLAVLCAQGTIRPEERALVPVTGFGLKDRWLRR
ncbi:MAG: pyridoxal-phosphate dependent enzyme [Dehalococcoidia bacterium]|nr:pyridoxal-phosphate dependent enzyme [Dehalococcoidia bacterium]MDW8120193.1 threonine synthase [Chloroflexota bacterium]